MADIWDLLEGFQSYESLIMVTCMNSGMFPLRPYTSDPNRCLRCRNGMTLHHEGDCVGHQTSCASTEEGGGKTGCFLSVTLLNVEFVSTDLH